MTKKIFLAGNNHKALRLVNNFNAKLGESSRHLTNPTPVHPLYKIRGCAYFDTASGVMELVGGPEEFCGVVAAALGFGEDFFFYFGGDLRGAGENPQVIVAAAAD